MRKPVNLKWLNSLFVLVCFCAFSQQKREKKIENFVIINYNKEEHGFFKNAQPTTVSYEEIETVEKIIKPKIDKNLKKFTYYRQYVAATNSEGDKLVYINFFTFKYLDINWDKTIVRAADGGITIFQVMVNLTKKDCFYYSQGTEG